MVFDYSKNLVTDTALQQLLELAEQCQLSQKIAAMFEGQPVNPTEKRPALHVALRGQAVQGLEEQVNATLAKMNDFVTAVRSGSWRGYTGKPIRAIVNIGIGGSHLGPAMVVRALSHVADSTLSCHFISNVDPAAGTEVLSGLGAETTLFIVASKSFTTLETHQNAQLARQWFLDNGGNKDSLAKHFVAVSSNIDAAAEFGIDQDNIFPMWDWVGGRYSLWSAIGLPIALYLGTDNFRKLLDGAHQADLHFLNSPLHENIPAMMGLLTVWYSGFFQSTSQVILPYSQNLELLPDFLQQLSMESLGKSVSLEGTVPDVDTGVVIWGAPGTDGQHSFHQLLHQGTRLIPADFIAFVKSPVAGHSQQQAHLLANCFSQSQALMDGKTLEQARSELQAAGLSESEIDTLAIHKVIPGNRPSNTFLIDQLDPYALGYLVALYEHSVFVQSAIWNINAFDQWGVELGKKLSTPIFESLTAGNIDPDFDTSTNNLIRICKNRQIS